jgi:flagellar biosynthesis/type III secretory pathway protein FliH
MTNNKQQTAVDWLIEKHFGGIENCTPDFRHKIEQAKEMEKKQIAEAESENSEAFADGYSKGYDRALELVKWALSNLIPPYNEKQ